MHGTVKWVDGVMTLAESGSGHSVVMDGPPELGGKNHGLRRVTLLVDFATGAVGGLSKNDDRLSRYGDVAVALEHF